MKYFGVVDDTLGALRWGAVEVYFVDEVVDLATQNRVKFFYSSLMLAFYLFLQFFLIVNFDTLADAPEHIQKKAHTQRVKGKMSSCDIFAFEVAQLDCSSKYYHL